MSVTELMHIAGMGATRVSFVVLRLDYAGIWILEAQTLSLFLQLVGSVFGSCRCFNHMFLA